MGTQTYMLQKILHKLLARRHFWRHASFSEVAELYMARLLRSFALHMVSLFVVVYLYKSGYSLLFIALYIAAYYMVKVGFAFLALWYVARFGPKHAILFSNLLYIPALIVFALVPEAGAPHALWVLMAFGLLQGASTTIYDYAYLVDFSKVKHADHAGKELGYMHILEKAASIVSPVLGGFLATYFGAEVTILVVATVFAVAAIPLMRTAEPIKRQQSIRWKGFPWRTAVRSVVAETGVGFDVMVTGAGWGLFLAAVVLVSQGDEVYASLGILSAIGMVVAFVSAFVFGRMIDKQAGGRLLRFAVLGKMVSHLMRPFVHSPVAAAGVNTISEVSTTGYSMAFMRGMFDTADLSGHRLVYLLFIEMAVNLGAALACAILALFVWLYEPQQAFVMFFVAAAGYVLVVASARFALYKR